MPPTLGGKSLVTSRCFTARLARSAGAVSTAGVGIAVVDEAASRSSRPSRRAAQTACARSIGSSSAR